MPNASLPSHSSEKPPGWRDVMRTLGNYIIATVMCYMVVQNFFRALDYFYPQPEQQVGEANKQKFDSALIDQLAKVTIYSMSDIGFASQPSAGKKIYDQIFRREQAFQSFKAILDSNIATLEAKAFALCGVKELRFDHYLVYRDIYASSRGSVSYMHGDVMEWIPAIKLASNIDEHGCV